MTEAELATVNAYRLEAGRAPLTESPGIRYLNYGKNKDGYWTYEHFSEQVSDVLDCIEALHPDMQACVEVSFSRAPSCEERVRPGPGPGPDTREGACLAGGLVRRPRQAPRGRAERGEERGELAEPDVRRQATHLPA